MKKILFFVPVLFFYQFAHASSDHLWINQVQITGGSGKTNYDFVEIFNPTASSIDLRGYRLVKRTQSGTTDSLIKSWTEETIVKAGGFYLWANSSFEIEADVKTSGTLADNNAIALRQGSSDTGTIVDSVGWGTAANAFVEGSVFGSNPKANEALLRTQDTDDNSLDFLISASNPRKSDSSTTPAQPEETTISPKYSIDIMIYEILPNPVGKDEGAEWVKFFNNSDSTIDLSGWILDDEGESIGKDAYVFSEGSKILTHDYLILNLPKENFSLDNTGGDNLRLLAPDRNQVANLMYTEDAEERATYVFESANTYVWHKIIVEEEEEEAIEELIAIPVKVVLSELFAEPTKDNPQQEFIELFNEGDQEVDLTGFKLSDLVNSFTLKHKILPQDFLVIKKSESKIALNNSGVERVTLRDLQDNEIAVVEYTNAPVNLSLNLTEAGGYVWSEQLTPGLTNQIVIPIPKPKKITAKKVVAVKVEPKSEPETLEPQVAAATITKEILVPIEKPIWPLLATSFALNLLFCYILVKLMLKKGAI